MYSLMCGKFMMVATLLAEYSLDRRNGLGSAGLASSVQLRLKIGTTRCVA